MTLVTVPVWLVAGDKFLDIGEQLDDDEEEESAMLATARGERAAGTGEDIFFTAGGDSFPLLKVFALVSLLLLLVRVGGVPGVTNTLDSALSPSFAL